ncbi:MAG: AsnC family transcriptional regulator, partial [Tsuneonella sp.]
MRLSNLADYAVVTMSAAARHCGGTRTSAGELA